MRILQLTSARYLGGGERHVVDLSRGLNEHGQEVFVGVAPNAPVRSELSFLSAENIPEFAFRGTLDFPTASSVARFASKQKIDIIHAHVARDYTIAAAASVISGIPFLITRHVLFPMSRLHRHLLRNTEFVIAPSNAVAASLRSQTIFPEDKVVTIRHGIASRADIGKRAFDRETFVIGTIGNLDPVKGFDVLIRAAAIVVAQFPHVRFEIAGDDRESDRRNERELRGLISSLGLDNKVALTGWSPNITETIAGFDLFVSSSRSESFGYALADAMAAGVPVVATETEGAKEVVGDSGQLVPVDSPEALADRLIQLIADPAERQELAEKGRKHIAENFSMERMIGETEALYRRAMAGS